MSRSVLVVVGLVAAALTLAAPALAHRNGAFHTKGQAENNIAKVLILATIQNPKLGATLDTRVVCSGFGARRGLRYNHFFCTIRGQWKGARSLTYHAKPGGHYDVNL